MSKEQSSQAGSLEGKSPFELRIYHGENISKSDTDKALKSGDIGFLHSYTTGSAVDGPGMRVVAWTTGCHWRCQYCHNPDTWKIHNGIPVTVASAVEELKKYRHGLKTMKGGFTLSGGEPLLQDRFAARLFAEVHAMGIHTAIDTNGTFGSRLSDEELKSIDLVMLGIKTWDPERHKKLTGAAIRPVLEFARRLAAANRPVWVRFVLVPGLTDNMGDISHIAKFCADLGNVERVDVLPFHQMGRYKWRELKLNYLLTKTKPPSKELIERVCSLFRAEGLIAY
ncbi:MAG: pyruvate formate-lyase-activating protein [Bacteroidota bacterium]